LSSRWGERTPPKLQISPVNLFLGCTASATATGNSLLGTFAGTGVCACTLPTNWQITTMSHATVTADLYQALYVHLNFTP
jgi:hypothetical protein